MSPAVAQPDNVTRHTETYKQTDNGNKNDDNVWLDETESHIWIWCRLHQVGPRFFGQAG